MPVLTSPLSGSAGMRQLFVAEVRAYPGRVAGAALACAATAAGLGASVLLLIGVSLPDHPENSVAEAAAQDAQNLLSLLMSLLLMCAVLVTGSTVSLWTGQRLSQFAVLRALGVTAGRLRGLVALDVARLGLVSAALGAAVGMVPLARLGQRVLLARELFPEGTPLPSPGQTWATAAAVRFVTAGVGVLAALASVLAAGRIGPAALLRDAELSMASTRSTGRLVTGLVLLVTMCAPLLFVMAFMDVPATLRAAMAPGVALTVIPVLAVLAPWIVPPLVRPTALAIRLLDRRVGRIAAAGLRETPARTTALAVPVLLSVGIAVSLLGAGATMGQAVQRQYEEGLRADAVVTAEPGTRLPATAPAFSGGSATALVATEVTAPPTWYDDRPVATRAWGADGGSLSRVLDLGVREGRMSAVGRGTFAAGAMQADGHHWRLGQRVRLALADGSPQTLTLVAVYERDLAFPEFVVARSAALRHTPAAYADRVLLTGPADDWPRGRGQKVASRTSYLDDLTPRNAADDLAARLVVAVVAGYALLAAANTSSLAQRDRRAQRAHLRAMGLGRFQLLRCVLYEAAGATVVGVALAAVTAGACLVPLSVILGTGAVPAVDVPWTVGVLAASVLAVALPAAVTAHPMSGVRKQYARRAA
ncbi:FtsX-like permease family protein [Streptomyces graminilatus]|uniref:FtsX-like permease family protein n=1 Tax=Streptomyces graminilatus TaxID=1464070 RepID=UPI000AA4D6E1|nr:FtsX-like permease family protein [Streptomyces graminilatus]